MRNKLSLHHQLKFYNNRMGGNMKTASIKLSLTWLWQTVIFN